jgi:hypothetical protein
VSRSILLASSRREAIEIALADFEARSDEHLLRPEDSDPQSVEDYLVKFDIAFGSVDDVVETLSHDAAVVRSTNYLFSLPFAPTGSPAYREGLEVLATEVHPRLRLRADAFTPRSSPSEPSDAAGAAGASAERAGSNLRPHATAGG